MMSIERIIKLESDAEPFPASEGCRKPYFSAFANGSGVECDQKAKP